MENKKIGIVVCNYNKENDVLVCIQSIIESKYTDYHVYVVDNGSKDNSVANIKANYGNDDRVSLIENQENLGGSGGFNTGLRAALKNNHEYLMCVDNDAMLDENCVGALYEFLETDKDTGIAAAKIYNTGMEDYIQQYGSFIDFDNYSVNSIYLNHIEDGTLPEVIYSDAVPACALMIRRSLVDEIGVMPEENFLYWDDTEWCFRCIAAGYKVASVGKAMACHAMGAKNEAVNTFPTYYAWRNWIVFFLEHIEEDQLDDMAEAFLGSIFEIAYMGLYRGEENKTKTVMAALDDALHGVMGKAGPDRIFDLEFSYDALERVLRGKKKLFIDEKNYPLYAEALQARIEELGIEIESSRTDRNGADIVITLCESIFRQDDLSLDTIMMDLDGNLLTNEDEVLMVINYNFSKRSFIFAQKPLFVRLAKELREKRDFSL